MMRDLRGVSHWRQVRRPRLVWGGGGAYPARPAVGGQEGVGVGRERIGMRCEVGVVCCGVAVLALGGCSTARDAEGRTSMTYDVQRLDRSMTIEAKWDAPPWAAAEPIELTHHMGKRPAHFPRTRAKVLYDDAAVYVTFRVEDRYVRAVAKRHQDSVCLDSCVEFFFTPGPDVSPGYFNLEMNCGGTMLFHWQVRPREGMVDVAGGDLARIEVAYTMPRTVDPQRDEPTTWTVAYRVPFEVVAKYCPGAERPGPGVRWRANFYKCADATSHPHWLTWAPVDHPSPDFHRPASFGTLVFK